MKGKRLIRFDWAIKRLLRNKANFEVVEGLLSELLGEDIKIQNFLESESNKETAYNKRNQVVILAQDANGKLIIIEIQGNEEHDYLMRMLFGTAKLIVDYAHQGIDYHEIKKVIYLNIVYFNIGLGDDYIYHGTTSFKGLHRQDLMRLSAGAVDLFHKEDVWEIYPDYYIINVDKFNDVSKNTLDEWVNFLKNEEINPDTKAKGLKKAWEALDVMKLSEKDKAEYEKDLRTWYDNKNAWNNRFADGKNEGIKEGIDKGIEIGEANKLQFAEEVAKDKVKQKETKMAKKCLKKGMPIPEISYLTGLTENEIKAIANNI